MISVVDNGTLRYATVGTPQAKLVILLMSAKWWPRSDTRKLANLQPNSEHFQVWNSVLLLADILFSADLRRLRVTVEPLDLYGGFTGPG